MANLSKPGTWKKEKSPFKYFSWFDGSIVLHFLDRSNNVKASEWQDFQVGWDKQQRQQDGQVVTHARGSPDAIAMH